MQIKAVSRTATIDLYVYTFVIHESNYRKEWLRLGDLSGGLIDGRDFWGTH